MASPFRIFRKHQKTWLAVLGLMAMIAFVFLPMVMDQASVRQNVDPVVVSTTRFGDLRQRDLQDMMGRQQQLLGFLERVQGAVQQAGGQSTEAMNLMQRIGVSPSEEFVVNTWLLSEEAKRQGLTIDDMAINQVLTAVADQRIGSEQIHAILGSLHMTERMLFESLRTQLLALRLQDLFQVSLTAATPAQRWDYFQRLYRKANVEVAAIPVIRFVDQVADPDEATLKEFFNDHKKQFPDPSSPEPGFRIPRKTAIEYFKANYEKVIQAAQVSDDDVRKYYEEHKEDYNREALPGKESQPQSPPAGQPESKSPQGTPQPEKPESPTAQEPSKGVSLPVLSEPAATKAPEGSTEKKPEPTAPAASESPAQPAAPTTAEGPAEKKADEPAAPKASEGSTEKKADEPAAPPKGSSSVGAASRFRLVSYSDDSAGATSEAKQPGGTPEPAKPGASGAEPAEKSAAEPTQSAEKAAAATTTSQSAPVKLEAEPAAPPSAAPAGQAATPAEKLAPAVKKPASGPEKPKSAAEKPKPVEYLPLKEVQDEIRQQLARRRAGEKIDKIFQGLQEKLNAYQNEWTLYDATVQEGTTGKLKPPARPDFQKLAEGTSLEVHKTGLVSPYEAYNLDIGKSSAGRTPFLQAAYAPSLLRFRPVATQDVDGNRYLFWKTEDVEERTPEFSDPATRKQVLHQWKMVQARSLAKKEATKLAEEARKANKPLKEVFAAQQSVTVSEAGPFSWMTYGSLPQMYWGYQRPTISDVESVEMPGNGFMRTLFQLQPGQTGVAMNAPETAAYVIRAVNFTPLPQVLWTLFLQESADRYAGAAIAETQEIGRSWLADMQKSSGLEWKREPTRPRQRAL